MNLDVKLYAGLRCQSPALSCHGEAEFRLELPEGTTLGELIARIGLKNLPLLCIVHERQQQAEYRLQDEDQVALFPPISGG